MKILSILFFLFLGFNAAAQHDLHSKNGVIYRHWPGYKMNGSHLNGKALRKEIFTVPAAVPFYTKATKNRTAAYVSLVPAIGSLLLADARRRQLYSNNKNGYDAACFIFTGAAFTFILRYSKNIKLAIRLHNEHQSIY